jgi:hypothetical protein
MKINLNYDKELSKPKYDFLEHVQRKYSLGKLFGLPELHLVLVKVKQMTFHEVDEIRMEVT